VSSIEIGTGFAQGRFWREFSENYVALAALAVVAVIASIAVLAPWVAPQNPYDLANLNLADVRKPPGFVGAGGYTHWLGTDAQGRDMLSAILFGLRISLQISLAAGAAALVGGSLMGASAAFLGGWAEALIMRIVDLQLSFPALLLALLLAALFGQGKVELTIALAAAQYAYYARTAHAAAAAERGKDYVEAALSVPLKSWAVVLRHILPNCFSPLIVVATIQVAHAISLEATLSFLGLGLPPTEPSLGMLISTGFQYMLSGRYWISIFPGLALLVLIVAVNLVGDQVRDQLNPRLKR
jgi:peptide/nickel transport system permease protein